jgi:soluble lytic murein transglycosylase
MVILLGGRVCTESAENATAGSVQVEAAASAAEAPAAPEFVEVAAESLLAFAAEDPRAQAAADLREAVAALERSDFDAALQRADAAVNSGVFAPDLVQYQRAVALIGLDRPAKAVLALGTIERSSHLWPEAVLEAARLMLAVDDGAGATSLLGAEGLDDDGKGRFNPAQREAAELLRSRALQARGQDGDNALSYRACKRVWLASGRDSEASNEAQACMEGLESEAPVDARLSLAEKVQRAQVLGAAHANKEVIRLLDPELQALRRDLREGGQTGCRGVYELGRAHHKQRSYEQSIPVLETIRASCPDPELRVKSLYLKAQGEGRAGRGQDSIATFVELSRRHPEHSYADDGLYHAGKQAQKDGDSVRARELFTNMAETFPDGDMVGKGLWGMAWAHLKDSDPQQALPWLEQLATGDPRGPQRDYVLMARYWQARALLEGNGGERTRAIEALSAQAVEEPLHYYGLLSLWKLRSLDPAAAANSELQANARALRAATSEPSTFHPERRFAESADVASAIGFLQGGFPARAGELLLVAIGDDPADDWKPATLLFASHLLELAGDPYASHNLLRKAFRTNHPHPLPEHRPVLTHAYPLAFHSEISTATRDFPWDPMLFQGLVREESAFMSAVVSWAGAMGLSQLMWPTAKETAKKMGIKGLKRTDLDQPALNLAIGSTYFQGLHKRWKGHLPLAIASYNAGPGAVNRWIKSNGDLELDMWVESIPFDQTRHYVKRVLSSFQTYHLMYDDGTAYVPLRIGPVRTAINEQDPVL